jgi:hypothetical protein
MMTITTVAARSDLEARIAAAFGVDIPRITQDLRLPAFKYSAFRPLCVAAIAIVLINGQRSAFGSTPETFARSELCWLPVAACSGGPS